MSFHRCQHTQIALDTSRVVIANILLNHPDKLTFAGKMFAIITFPLQNAPEALHRAVINTMRCAGHALCHSCLHKPVIKCAVGVLETSVAMKQGMYVRIGLHSLVEGFENQRIVVALTEHVRHDAPVTEIQNGAQIELVELGSLVPLEFCYIGEPLLIGLCGIKLSVQKILGKILRIFCVSGAATVAVLDRRTDIFNPADAEHSLVVDMNAAVMAQIVIEPPVALIRAFRMELFKLLRSPAAQLSGSPFVVSRMRCVEQLTGRFNGKSMFFMAFLNDYVNLALLYFREASLLSISSNFFSSVFSISARYSLCLSCSISIWAFSSSVLGT